MNSFGNNFRLNIFGESHGPAVGIVIDGCLPGIPISMDEFSADLNRRKGGVLNGTTQRAEPDIPECISGIFNGYTTGTPITLQFRNSDVKSEDYTQRDIPRPGHADFIAGVKFKGYQDYRGGGHFSGRLTVCLVAAGVIAKKMLKRLAPDLECNAFIKEAGGETDVEAAVQKAIETNDSIGGIVECICKNVPSGLGEPFFNSVESVLSHALFSIPAIKGVEFGSGFAAAQMKGSVHNDVLISEEGKTKTNNAGGVTGGLSNGNELLFRVCVKPASSTPKEQESLNLTSGNIEKFTVKGRHDLAIVLRVPVVVEAVACCVLTDMFLSGK